MYQQLALQWHPQSNTGDRLFKVIALVSVLVLMLLGLLLSSIDVPRESRKARQAVPERIANFVLKKKQKKPEPKIEKPKPKPKPRPKPKIKKIKKKAAKPLTKTQKKARKKAAETGLLALSNELSDLMDTSDVSSMVGGKVKASSASATRASSNNKALLMADASQGSGGVNASQYGSTVGKTRLSQREITQVRQALLSPEAQAKASGADKRKSRSRSGGVRAEEDITIVFDQNKSKLYSIYNRERRKDPGLKGKIVLEITIAPSGKVVKIRIVSSELNNKKLERRLLNRIKQFNFGAQKVETITVTYPIEFLPS